MLEHDSYGDILVFLNGERDIAECADFLRKANLKATEVLPLYARLSNQEQNRIFEAHTGRRIVLATNVAETSITVPGIKYVIDPGTARISRYNTRNKVQRLPIEPISQASADQRKGRCGRVQNGICVRLYSEIDYINRKQFTDPEILRTNLSAVILRMLSLHIEDIYSFPFIESPEEKQIRDGLRLLEELGAVTYIKKKVLKESLIQKKDSEGTFKNKIDLNELSDHKLNQERFEIKELPVLTKIGKQMASIPCDPRLARMLIEANEQHALKELLIIVSNLSAQETRERPLQWREAANTALGHDWKDATCTAPKTCKRCGITEGDLIPHDWSEWDVKVEPTHNKTGWRERHCKLCNRLEAELIPAKGGMSTGAIIGICVGGVVVLAIAGLCVRKVVKNNKAKAKNEKSSKSNKNDKKSKK
jgi:ATP-dependent helicase HrpA